MNVRVTHVTMEGPVWMDRMSMCVTVNLGITEPIVRQVGSYGYSHLL